MHSIRYSWFLALLSASCLTLFAGACAKPPHDDSPELPSGSANNNPSDGGFIPSPGGNTAGGSSGGSSDGGSTSTSACNPIGQTGCSGATSQCGLAGSKFDCIAPGTIAVGSACTTSGTGDNCVPGAACVNPSGSGGYQCHKICSPSDASTCPSDSLCALRLSWNGGSTGGGETFDLCVPKGSACSLLAQDCTDAQLGCFSTSAGSQCLTPGTLSDGAACVSANDCLKGSTCIGLGGAFKCSKLCTPTANPDAGTGTTDAGTSVACAVGACRGLTGETFGVCQ